MLFTAIRNHLNGNFHRQRADWCLSNRAFWSMDGFFLENRFFKPLIRSTLTNVCNFSCVYCKLPRCAQCTHTFMYFMCAFGWFHCDFIKWKKKMSKSVIHGQIAIYSHHSNTNNAKMKLAQTHRIFVCCRVCMCVCLRVGWLDGWHKIWPAEKPWIVHSPERETVTLMRTRVHMECFT